MKGHIRWSTLVFGLVVLLPLVAIAAYPNYDFVDNWGGPGANPGEFVGPAGVTQGPYGEVFVTDSESHEVEVFDADGTFLRQFGELGTGDAQMEYPWLIEVTEDGIIYLADYGNDRISVWDTDGDYLYSFGTFGSGNGQFSGPTDVTVGSDGLLYVADYGNHRIQVLETDGTYVRKWGSLGAADGQFSWPIAVEFDSEGRLWVADSGNHRLQYFTTSGTFLGKFGTPGTGNGEFDNPYDIRFDPHGDMYVADSENDRVQKFTADGDFVTKFGTFGTGDGQFDFTAGLQVTDERYVLATDYDNDRVQRWFTAVPTKTQPIAGNTRYSTAVEASKASFPKGLSEDSEGFKTVIIATGENWPDALGGSALAGVLDAPILLVETDALPAAVSAEIARLGATRAIVLGQTAAVSTGVASAIDALPGVAEVARLGGSDRIATAEFIAMKVVELQGPEFDGMAFVATAENFPDALACSPIAAANGWPLYLAPVAGISGSTLGAMQADNITDAYILGGPVAVSTNTEGALNTLLGDAQVNRLEGDNRYETGVEVAWFGQAEANMNWTYTALATGKNFPDALTGGPLQGRDRSVMLLTDGTTALEPVVAGAIQDHKNAIWTMRYLGGTAVVSEAVRAQVGNLLY